jgi:hypothetical protein
MHTLIEPQRNPFGLDDKKYQLVKMMKEKTPAMSTALEITPPAPAINITMSSWNHSGRSLPLLVHPWVNLPVCVAFAGENVEEDIPSGVKIRSSTKEV